MLKITTNKFVFKSKTIYICSVLAMVLIFLKLTAMKTAYRKLTQKEIKQAKASDFSDGTVIEVLSDKNNETIYFIWLIKGQYSSFGLKSKVENKFSQFIDCTPGVKGGRPYYIHDFINR